MSVPVHTSRVVLFQITWLPIQTRASVMTGEREKRLTKFRLPKKRVNNGRRSRLGISTIMANLLMLIIVVTLSSLLFTWSVSSFSGYQSGAGFWFSSRSNANQERPNVENVFFSSGGNCPGGYPYCVTLYVRNVGTIPITISSIYLNQTLYSQSYPPILVNGVQQFQFPLIGQSWLKGDLQTITVATSRGTTVQTTWVS